MPNVPATFATRTQGAPGLARHHATSNSRPSTPIAGDSEPPAPVCPNTNARRALRWCCGLPSQPRRSLIFIGKPAPGGRRAG